MKYCLIKPCLIKPLPDFTLGTIYLFTMKAYLIKPLPDFTLGTIYLFDTIYYYKEADTPETVKEFSFATHSDSGFEFMFYYKGIYPIEFYEHPDFQIYFKTVEDFREERLNKII